MKCRFVGFVMMALTALFVLVSAPAIAAPSFGPPPPGGGLTTGDADNDGLSNSLEQQLGTDPNNPDIDGDRIRDGLDPDTIALAVSPLPVSAFANGDGGLKTAILSRLQDIQAYLKAGNVDEATRTLENLRKRMDGCPPKADKDDWIVECSAQQRVRSLLDLQIGNHFSFAVDKSLVPVVAAIPGLSGGPLRPVGLAVGPDGKRESFVANEVVLKPSSADDLNRFLTKYGGVVLRDGTPQVLPGVQPPPGLPATSGWYLVRVNTNLSSLDDIDANMEALGFRGKWSFSSEDVARLASLAARERGLAASPNFLMDLPSSPVWEHPADGGGNIDAAKWWWMTEDDDPNTPGDQGLSIGVVHAWEYVKYKGYPPANTPFVPIRVAVVDNGFDLDETTGVPLFGVQDYSGTPAQIDEVDHDGTAGGKLPGFGNHPDGIWHGQMSFGGCCALSNNGFGTAGTSGGNDIKPLVIKVGTDFYTVAAAVLSAVHNRSDVINTGVGNECGWACKNYGGGNPLRDAVLTAMYTRAIVVCPSDNQGIDISGTDHYPCSLNGAVCVGAITKGGAAQFNWGSPVDTWAPTGYRTTVTRDTAICPTCDPNNTGEDELFPFGGTSASSPFVAGVVALMKMVHPDLTYEEVRSILVSTANPSSDPKIAPKGYVDAFRAVKAASPNLAPTVKFLSPLGGASTGYQDVEFKVEVVDPEKPSPAWIPADFSSTVVFSSNRDGKLCEAKGDATGNGTTLRCTSPVEKSLTLGAHVITATVSDPFGEKGNASVTVEVKNEGPTAKIVYPPSGSTYYPGEQVSLVGYGFDPDGKNLSIPDSRLTWNSSIDGTLGTGKSRSVTLSKGNHTITLTAEDELGIKGTDNITVNVVEGTVYPFVEITSPSYGTLIRPGATTTFSGRATDPQEGEITDDTAFKWYSSLDGPLGTGRSIQKVLTWSGESTEHVIILEVTDKNKHKTPATIRVYVTNVG